MKKRIWDIGGKVGVPESDCYTILDRTDETESRGPAGIGATNLEDCRLIVAAPELLEACKALVSAHENAPFESKSTAFNKALAAIAKAEGRE